MSWHRRVVRLSIVVLAAAACGAPPAPAPIVIHDPPPPPRTPRPVTCGDAGVILRGEVERPKVTGPTKEATIASACLTGAWPQAVLDCIATDPRPRSCLTKLDASQLDLLARKIESWVEVSDGEALDFTRPKQPLISCVEGVGDVAFYRPFPQGPGDNADFIDAIRRSLLVERCEVGWPEQAKHCFATSRMPDDCRRLLPPREQKGVTADLDRIGVMMVRVLVFEAQPAMVTCAKVVGAHYSNARWQAKLPLASTPARTLARRTADRKYVIAESRRLMLEACKREQWSLPVRACYFANDIELCERAVGQRMRWTFPAKGVVPRTGIPDCDTFLAVAAAYATCPKVPATSRQAIQRTVSSAQPGWATALTNPRTKQAAATGCKQAVQALRQSAKRYGCTI